MNDSQSGAPGRTVLLAGSTGLVGRSLLEGLLADNSVAMVHALGRRKLNLVHPRLTWHIIDFAAVPPLPRVAEVYLALGTTIRDAGSQAAFRAVDFDSNLAVARAALKAGARRCGLVSSMGANARSGLFYSKVKGELEEALGQLPFSGLVIARPSLLVGDRAALGQPARSLETASLLVSRVLRPLIPINYRPISAARVARALLNRTPSAAGHIILSSGDMQ